jgi:hypothetical protein
MNTRNTVVPQTRRYKVQQLQREQLQVQKQQQQIVDNKRTSTEY